MMRSAKIAAFVLMAIISHDTLGFTVTLPAKLSLSVHSCSSSRIYTKNSNLPSSDKADNDIEWKGEEGADYDDCAKKPLHRRATPAREPDSPDRALAIVSELKSNAALFAAFAYGGLSLPSLMTVTESKITSVTTSISTARPLPGSDLIQAFVILDTATLCLMIACVAASQLLIYRLTDGSWYKEELEEATSHGASSAMGRLMTDYGLEFTVARTTFDFGLLVLLLAVAVRAISIFDASISLPILILLGTTSLMLAGAYLQSYFKVFRPIEKQSQREAHGGDGPTATLAITLVPPILLAVVAAMFYSNADPNLPTTTNFPPPNNEGLSARLAEYSSAAGESKLKLTAGRVAGERSVSSAGKDSSKRSSKKPKTSERATLTPKKEMSSSGVDEKSDSSKRKEFNKKVSSPENVVAEEDGTGSRSEMKDKAQKASRPEIVAAEEDNAEKKDKVISKSTVSSSKDEISTVLDDILS